MLFLSCLYFYCLAENKFNGTYKDSLIIANILLIILFLNIVFLIQGDEAMGRF